MITNHYFSLWFCASYNFAFFQACWRGYKQRKMYKDRLDLLQKNVASVVKVINSYPFFLYLIKKNRPPCVSLSYLNLLPPTSMYFLIYLPLHRRPDLNLVFLDPVIRQNVEGQTWLQSQAAVLQRSCELHNSLGVSEANNLDMCQCAILFLTDFYLYVCRKKKL